MNKNVAKQIAKTITNEQLQHMIKNASKKITNWEKVSVVNKSFTKGVAWNSLCRNFDVNHNYHIFQKMNMIREFGEFLPDEIKPQKRSRKRITPIHQDPQINSKEENMDGYCEFLSCMRGS